jgi:transposase-like protein
MPRYRLRALVPPTLPRRRRWSAADAGGVLEEVAASGLSLREFAARANLSAQRLYRWRRQLQSSPAATPPFVEIRPTGSAGIEVLLRSGHVLRVGPGFDEETVLRLVRALEDVQC